MNDTNNISNSLPILDVKNWIRWRKQMQSLFGFHEILEVVTNGIPELTENAIDAQRVANNEAKKKHCKTEEDEKIAGYVSKVNNLVHLIKGYGETLNQKMIVEKVMCTLTSHFSHVIVAIEESNNLETVKLEDLVRSLEAREIRIIERKWVQVSIQELQAHAWKKHDGFGKFKGKGDKTQSKKFWSNPQSTRSMIWLLNPRKEEEETPIRKTKRKNARSAITVKSRVTWQRIVGILKTRDQQKSTRKELILHGKIHMIYEDMIVMVAVAGDHVESKIWFLDSGCSNHMTSQKVWLEDFDSSKKSKVKLADNSSFQVEGTGDIVFQRSNLGKAMIKAMYLE
ncbi:uncharacterized protein LOC127129501 [Lathyrus oleraceus]|uniref:uncharacterized protein LOC127129501 n=1 Tax=Pisum sativum TaxID=3888 RepID=UPI0021D25A22|nr:uncharacterized protein LOC127129501 [Pisum sativum]